MISIGTFQVSGDYVIVPYYEVKRVLMESLKPDPNIIANPDYPDFDYSKLPPVVFFDSAVFYRTDVHPWQRTVEWEKVLDGEYGMKPEYWGPVDCDDYADLFKAWMCFRFKENCYLRCLGTLEVIGPDGNVDSGYHAFNAWLWIMLSPDKTSAYCFPMIVEPQLNAWIPVNNGAAEMTYYDDQGREWKLKYRVGAVLV